MTQAWIIILGIASILMGTLLVILNRKSKNILGIIGLTFACASIILSVTPSLYLFAIFAVIPALSLCLVSVFRDKKKVFVVVGLSLSFVAMFLSLSLFASNQYQNGLEAGYDDGVKNASSAADSNSAFSYSMGNSSGKVEGYDDGYEDAKRCHTSILGTALAGLPPVANFYDCYDKNYR